MQKTRRITTGYSKAKKSTILADEYISTLIPYDQSPSFQLQNLFYTEDNPQSLQTKHLATPYDINLPEGAMRFLKVRMPTKKEMIKDLQAAGQPIPDDWRKFNLHSTNSVDYIYILSGEITCIVGEEEFDMKVGDFLVQIGPEHTWLNDHDEPCYLLCVMLGTKPSTERKKMTIE